MIERGLGPLVPPGWLEPVLHPSYIKLLLRFGGYSEAQIGRHFTKGAELYSYLELHNIVRDLQAGIEAQTALDFGLNTSLAAHGMYGQAAVASANLNQAMSVIATFKPTRNNVFSYHWTSKNGYGVFTMTPRFDLQEYRETSTLMTLVNMVHIAGFIAGEAAIQQMELTLPRDFGPLPALRNLEGLKVRRVEAGERATLKTPAENLFTDNIFADARQFDLACWGCEEELDILKGRYTERVRSLISHQEELADGRREVKWRSLPDISRALALSTRTLNRRLKDENTSYGDILEQTRSEMACWYLKNTDLSVARISEILGYNNDTNFSRTFKRWRAVPPLAYRSISCLEACLVLALAIESLTFMKVFFLFAHPEPQKSYQRALLDAGVDALQAAGHETRVSDLYAMGFNSLASEDDFSMRRFPERLQYDREQKYAVQNNALPVDIEAELEKVFWCDLFVMQFPLYWFSMPAIMKGWFDRVFVNSVVYGAGKRFETGGLKGRRAIVCTTTGAYAPMFAPDGLLGDLNAALWHIHQGILHYTGFEVLEPFVGWSPVHTGQEACDGYLADYGARLLGAQEAAPMKFHDTADFDDRFRLLPEIEPQTLAHRR